ncbi:MAG: 30S ribosomal protein S6, partial [Planctomycetota bacterium]|nr:30S ribosomal protein S6 [Planctomycetota bacterium]
MTETATMNTYEGMFLFPQIASSDLKAAQEHVEYLISRGEGEIISLAKWDERRLAYEIKGNRRGLYFLTYFKATGEGAIEIERQVNLSEQLLRAMILKADLVPADVIAAADAREQLAQEIVERAAAEETEAVASTISSREDFEAQQAELA